MKKTLLDMLIKFNIAVQLTWASLLASRVVMLCWLTQELGFGKEAFQPAASQF